MESSTQFDSVLLAAKVLGIPFLLALAGSIPAGAWRMRGAPHPARLGGAIAVLCGFLGGYAAFNYEQWQFPPAQALDWLPLLAVSAVLMLSALEVGGAGERVWLGGQLVLAMLATWLMLPPALRAMDAVQIALAAIQVCVVWIGVWRHLDQAGVASPGAAVALTLASGALGLVVALGGSILIGCIAISLMGALAGWTLASLATGAAPLPRALLGAATVLFGSLVLAAYFYAELPLSLVTVLVAGLLLARLVPAPKAGRPWRALALAVAVTSAPPVLALGMSVWTFLHQPAAYY